MTHDIKGATDSEAGGARAAGATATDAGADRARAGQRIALAVVVMAAGVFAVSVADAAGRGDWPGGNTGWTGLYWLGELLIFAPPAALVLSRTRLGEAAAAWLTVAIAVATYLVKYAYSPSFFTFPDELEHWRSLVLVLSTHHLFGTNYVLPVSPDYPGLEIVTSALMNLTGLGGFPAGLIVAGVAHVTFAVALYTLFRRVGGQPRIGLAAVTVYATSPHYQVFDAIFGYQTLALAFYGLAIVACHAATRPDVGRRQVATGWTLAAVFAAATVATHHVTSFVLVGTVALIAVTGTVADHLARRAALGKSADGQGATVGAGLPRRGDDRKGDGGKGDGRGRRRGAVPAEYGFTVGVAALIGVWIWRAAPTTGSYLSPAIDQLASSVRNVLTGHLAKASTVGTLSAPLGDRLASYAVAVLIMVVIPAGWRQIWRTQRDEPWALALAAGAVVYYPCVVLPLISADGSELAGRMLTFVYIPVGYTLAMALFARPRDRRRQVVGAVAAAVLLVGGLASGWPPWWERLPGHYAVDGFESGVTPEGVAAATWAGAYLGPGQRIAADYTNNLLMGGYGGLSPVNNVDILFCSPAWGTDEALIARQNAVEYLAVDLRTSTDRPPTGSYFTDATSGCPVPIPRSALTKFATTPGFIRIYDSGNIIIYRLTEAAYAPAAS